MSANIIKADTKEEARRQMLMVDKTLADTITRRLEIEERRKELKEQIRASRAYEELKTLSKEDKMLIVAQHEQNGARKMIFALLKKFGIPMPETKLSQLINKNETARQMIPA